MCDGFFETWLRGLSIGLGLALGLRLGTVQIDESLVFLHTRRCM